MRPFKIQVCPEQPGPPDATTYDIPTVSLIILDQKSCIRFQFNQTCFYALRTNMLYTSAQGETKRLKAVWNTFPASDDNSLFQAHDDIWQLTFPGTWWPPASHLRKPLTALSVQPRPWACTSKTTIFVFCIFVILYIYIHIFTYMCLCVFMFCKFSAEAKYK